MGTVIFLATRWGSQQGGINSFNTSLTKAVADYLKPSHEVYCVTLYNTLEEERDAGNVKLLHISENQKLESFTPDLGENVIKCLPSSLDFSSAWWVGHDDKTGAVAQWLKQHTAGSRFAIFHHMDFSSYALYKYKDATKVREKDEVQQKLLAAADPMPLS